MAFSFGTTALAPPPASPVERRQKPLVVWSDSAVTIDTWLVEVYFFRPDGTLGSVADAEAYVTPRNNTSNSASIDISEYIPPRWTQPEGAYYTFVGAFVYPAPSSPGILEFVAAADGYQFQVYSVTNGVKSALQGSFNYISLNFAKKQKWNFDGGYETIFEYYPDSLTKKGWLTNREATTFVRYDMALEDEGTVNALYLGNYDYAYETGKNTNNANWDQVRYTVYYNGVQQNILLLDKPSDVNSFGSSVLQIPIGPANIKDNTNWTLSYDINTQPWDYIQVELIETSTVKCKPIRVYRDCRPQKHKPAQLYWMGTKGVEILRFDGRVKDNYDVSGRDAFTVNTFFDSNLSGIDNLTDYISFLPETYQQEALGTRSFSLSEDFFTQAERELFKTAITSSIMMVRYADKWYPCRLKTTNYTHEQASSRLAPIRLEVEVTQALRC
jgi:hypothetical protein